MLRWLRGYYEGAGASLRDEDHGTVVVVHQSRGHASFVQPGNCCHG